MTRPAGRANRRHQDAGDFVAGKPVNEALPFNNTTTVAPVINNIPEAMRTLPRWVVWRHEERNGKSTKVPFSALTGKRAASDDPQTWSAFETATEVFDRGGWAGIGFMLGDGFVGIDLDHCRNPETGEIEPKAAQVIQDIRSYAEASPSGTGIHIVAKGKLPDGRRRIGTIEMYDSGRYFTVTGNVVGEFRDVGERQAEIEALHARIFAQCSGPPKAKAPGPEKKANERPSSELLILNPEANPPFDKFEALRVNDKYQHFTLSWEHRRADFKGQSQSAYDQSLANIAAMAEWTDQQITDLVVANRRKHGADLKLRQDYYRNTIAKAREAAEPVLLDRKIAQLVQLDSSEQDMGTTSTVNDTATSAVGAGDPESTSHAEEAEVQNAAVRNENPEEPSRPGISAGGLSTGGTEEPKKRALLETLSSRFKVPIRRIIKYIGEPTLYRLETALGDVQLGGVAGLITQAKLRISIADATGRYLPHIDADCWPDTAQALLDACEPVDRGADATMRGTLAEWLGAYLREKTVHATLAEADEGREPFLDGADVCFFTGDFRRWLQMRLGERVAQGKLTADLRAFGAEPKIFTIMVKKKLSTRSAWKLPGGLLTAPEA